MTEVVVTAESTPQPVPAQPEPVSVQVTPLVLLSETDAVKKRGWPSSTVCALLGESCTVSVGPAPPQPATNATQREARSKYAAECQSLQWLPPSLANLLLRFTEPFPSRSSDRA